MINKIMKVMKLQIDDKGDSKYRLMVYLMERIRKMEQKQIPMI